MNQEKLLFRYLTAINYSKKNFLLDEHCIEFERFAKEYSPYVIGGFLAGDLETLPFANAVNIQGMDPKKHFVFLLHTIRKKNRFVKWPQKNKGLSDTLKRIAFYYDCSLKKAREYLPLLSEEQIKEISDFVDPLLHK